ncbi:MAG: substrate-binding domain-containing protein [Micrococcales bacterium]
MRKTAGLLASAAILATALLGAPAANAAAGDVVAGGSSFAGGIIQACATNYAAAYPSQGSVTYTKNASQTGKDNFRLGTYDFGGTDFIYSNTNGDNLPSGAKYVAVTSGPIAIIYNLPTVVNLKLTPQVIAKIFKGQITSWDDTEITSLQVNTVKTAISRLASKNITPAYRTAGSGTSFNFAGYLAQTTSNFTQSSDWSEATGDATPRGNSYSSSSNLKTGVTNTAGSIGYVDLKDAGTLQKALLRNEAGQYYAPDAKRSATFLNAQLASTVKTNGNVDIDWNKSVSGGYNATLITYAVVNTSGSVTAKGANVKKFLQYVLNVCGPSISYGLGYTPIQGAIRTKAYAVLNLVK